MKKKLFITTAAFVLIVIAGFAVYKFLGGFPVGLHNGRLVIYQYFCSDVCPQYGGWHKEYFGVKSPEDCERIGGFPLIDAAWGGFVGCAPQDDNSSLPPQTVASTPRLSIGENITVAGTVMKNDRSCVVDAYCVLTLDTKRGVVEVIYDFGRSVDPHAGGLRTCTNQNARKKGMEVEKGQRVEVFGKVIGENSISPCDSQDFYIK